MDTLNRPFLANLALAAALSASCASPASNPPDPPESTVMNIPAPFDPAEHVDAATSVLRRYEAALNQADVDAISALYEEDAVFMAQHRIPAVGRQEIEVAYKEIFGMIRLDITFQIDEVVVVSPTVAYARTRSAGTTTIVADGAEVSEANQELFILVRTDHNAPWRIGRYIFSTTNPPRG